MIISTIDFVTSTEVKHVELQSFFDLPRTDRLKNENPPLWSPYRLKNRRSSSVDEVEIYALIIDWDHEILPKIQYRHFRHTTHSGRWRLIVPLDVSMKLAAQDFSLFYDEIMSKIGLVTDDKTLGITGYDVAARSLSQFFYYPHVSVTIDEIEGEQLLSTIFLTQTSKIRRLWRKDYYPNFEIGDMADRYHKKILDLHKGYKDSCDFSELRLSNDHCWFHKEKTGELDLNTFESTNKSIGANIHCYHTNCFANNKQFIIDRYLIEHPNSITETSAYLMRGLIEKFWDWNFIEEMYLPKVLKSKHHLLTKLNIYYPENDVKLLKSILYDDKIVFNPDENKFYLFQELIYKGIDVKDIGDRINTRLFKWYRYLGYGRKHMKEWIAQLESSIRDKKLEELKLESGLALKNGILTFDRHTGDHTLHPNDGSYFVRDFKDYNYDPEAECPRWMQALDEWFDDKYKTKKLLQEFAGYCLTDWRHFEKFLVMYNKPGAGKNTIANVLMDLTSSSACLLERLGTENICADLAHFKMLFCDEKVSSIRVSVLDTLKQLVTTSPVFCRPLHGKVYSSKIFPKLLLSFNEVPDSFKVDDALKRRLLVINFRNSFTKAELNTSKKLTDPNLGETLSKELSGILNWALKGLKRLCAQGFFTIDQDATNVLIQKVYDNDIERYNVYKFIDDLRPMKPFFTGSELFDLFRSFKENKKIGKMKFLEICRELPKHIVVRRTAQQTQYIRTDHVGIEEPEENSDIDL